MRAFRNIRSVARQASKRASQASLASSSPACTFATSSADLTFDKYPFLPELGIEQENSGVFNGQWLNGRGQTRVAVNPATNEPIATVLEGDAQDLKLCFDAMDAAKPDWQTIPVPLRGEIVRKIGEKLREHREALGSLVSLEMGKILAEGIGEVQEAIDICDYAVGLSRSLNGSVIPSERPGHFMMERWNPLKNHVGIISAFNFPCAVFFWNTAISLVAGNTQIWKASESGSLVAIACTKLIQEVFEEEGISGGVASLIQGPGNTVGEALIQSPKVDLISFTGSTAVGRHVNQVASNRFAKTILELGGNNAMIVMDDADQELALRGALFGAVGTAGQRCTSLRRLMIHEDIYDEFLGRLRTAYANVKIGDQLESSTLCGPLHNPNAVQQFLTGVSDAKAQGGKVLIGGEAIEGPGNFVQPTIVEIDHDAKVVQHEVFAPLLYVIKIKSLEQAIELNNSVPQGLSSSLFTTNQQAIFKWSGPEGSDCGIVNVNIGPSGAEIGGAFGGEKETGGGRESGSDAWKQYMRRSTCTINHSDDLPLAQGISFD